ncbi:hypothetical protein PsYK624_034750 [Phanerochaete sordida]|uniref:Uncharacterized protein n=1 Tax=Phanerochaete sordida TaxID=48140 RepID=A0A9P3G3F6_9APHY|nr:hypothetical protein PsYK624_034750 [Phanerochaete sordida]
MARCLNSIFIRFQLYFRGCNHGRSYPLILPFSISRKDAGRHGDAMWSWDAIGPSDYYCSSLFLQPVPCAQPVDIRRSSTLQDSQEDSQSRPWLARLWCNTLCPWSFNSLQRRLSSGKLHQRPRGRPWELAPHALQYFGPWLSPGLSSRPRRPRSSRCTLSTRMAQSSWELLLHRSASPCPRPSSYAPH